jgi:hypothetical protein
MAKSETLKRQPLLPKPNMGAEVVTAKRFWLLSFNIPNKELPNGSRQGQVGGLRLAVETEQTQSREKG